MDYKGLIKSLDVPAGYTPPAELAHVQDWPGRRNKGWRKRRRRHRKRSIAGRRWTRGIADANHLRRGPPPERAAAS